MNTTTIGLDIAKAVFQVHGIDARGQTTLRKRLRRAQRYSASRIPGFPEYNDDLAAPVRVLTQVAVQRFRNTDSDASLAPLVFGMLKPSYSSRAPNMLMCAWAPMPQAKSVPLFEKLGYVTPNGR